MNELSEFDTSYDQSIRNKASLNKMKRIDDLLNIKEHCRF